MARRCEWANAHRYETNTYGESLRAHQDHYSIQTQPITTTADLLLQISRVVTCSYRS